jgi:hypothetical protein
MTCHCGIVKEGLAISKRDHRAGLAFVHRVTSRRKVQRLLSAAITASASHKALTADTTISSRVPAPSQRVKPFVHDARCLGDTLRAPNLAKCRKFRGAHLLRLSELRNHPIITDPQTTVHYI